MLSDLLDEMCLLMCFARAFRGEPFLAHTALEWSQAQMTIFMVDQTLFGLETHATNRTFVRLIGTVRFHVNGKVALNLESFAAEVAGKLEISCKRDERIHSDNVVICIELNLPECAASC